MSFPDGCLFCLAVEVDSANRPLSIPDMRFSTHPALRHRSPSGLRSPVAHLSTESVNPQVGQPPIGAAGGPAPPVEPVFGAGQHGHPLMDVAVDTVELPVGVAVPEVVPPAPQHG